MFAFKLRVLTLRTTFSKVFLSALHKMYKESFCSMFFFVAKTVNPFTSQGPAAGISPIPVFFS